jgi:hypothetical protein
VLVEHSLVVVSSDADGTPRFGLLEPVAQYARTGRPTRSAAGCATRTPRASWPSPSVAPLGVLADQVV